MKKLFVILFLVLISLVLLNADYYIKQEIKGTVMGKQNDQISEQWIGKNKMAVIGPDGSFIIDMKTKKMFIINHKNKTYIETDYPLDFSKIVSGQGAQMMKGMLDSMTVNVKETGQTKKIGQWNCKEYEVKIGVMGMEMKMNLWNSTDVKFDWKDVSKMQAEMMKMQFKMGEKFVNEYKKIKGFQIAMEMNAMGTTMKSTVLEISKKSPPSNTYSVPKGYKKQDKLTSMR